MCGSSKTGVRDKMRIPQLGKRTCRDLHAANYPQLRVVSAHDSHGHRRRIGFPQFGSLSAGSWRGAPTRPAFKSLRGQVRGSSAVGNRSGSPELRPREVTPGGGAAALGAAVLPGAPEPVSKEMLEDLLRLPACPLAFLQGLRASRLLQGHADVKRIPNLVLIALRCILRNGPAFG